MGATAQGALVALARAVKSHEDMLGWFYVAHLAAVAHEEFRHVFDLGLERFT
jgi:hypothetical protein